MIKPKFRIKSFIFFIFAFYAVFSCCALSFFKINSYYNYKENVNYDYQITGLINNQDLCEYYKYGSGNIPDNGCGAVSIYNILYLDGKNPTFSSVIHGIDQRGLLINGQGGTNFFEIIFYLNKLGYKTSLCLKESNFENFAKKNKYNIIMYFSFEKMTGHYQVCYDYNSYDNTFKFLNYSYRKTMQNYFQYKTKYKTRLIIGVN